MPTVLPEAASRDPAGAPVRPAVAAAALVAILAYSGFRADARFTWLAEVSPVVVGVPLLAVTFRRFRFTNLVYGLIFVEAVVCIVGGTYGYEHVPLGNWIRDLLHGTRNPYDKIAHFAQGFVPALIIREYLVRRRMIRTRGFLPMTVVWGVLTVGAISEMVEWGAALAFGRGADDFLATQGDPFDTQSDLFFDLLGGFAALAFLSRAHDRGIAALEEELGAPARLA